MWSKMDQTERPLKPWEISPDEAYWRALLQEDEYIPTWQGAAWLSDAQAPLMQTVAHSLDISGDTSTQSVSPEWSLAQTLLDSGQPIELTVSGYNRGGLLVEWNGLTGFVPASQICIDLPHGDEAGRMKALAARVGETLLLKVIECEPERNRLILSELDAQASLEPNHDLLAALHPGDVCRGRVTNLCSFGAFVDLGGVEGLIHISELSWKRITHPQEVLQNGQEIDVYVLGINPQQGRVALSLKRLQADPWHAVEQRYTVGQWVDGTVTSVVSFGAFVRLEEGLEGLLHISKLRGNHAQPTPKLVENQPVRVRILNIDSAQHRIGLSLE